jgi:hypothetical protein
VFISVNLAPNDFNLFGPLKKELASKQFVVDVNVKQAVTWLQTPDTDFLYIKIQALVTWWWQ